MLSKLNETQDIVWFDAYNGTWAIVLIMLMSILLIVYYMHMYYVLNKFFSNALKQEKRKIFLFFLTFMFAYTLRSIISLVLHYIPYGFVC